MDIQPSKSTKIFGLLLLIIIIISIFYSYQRNIINKDYPVIDEVIDDVSESDTGTI